MTAIKIQHSKDTFCDYLLVHAWRDFFDVRGLGFAKNDAEHYIELHRMTEFAKFLADDGDKPFERLQLFGIKNDNDLMQILRQAYDNLREQGLTRKN